jgi:hypothetical protein
MQFKSQITTALLGTSLFAGLSFAEGQTITEMLEAASTSYSAISTTAFTPEQANAISSRLLAKSEMPMVASPMSLDGQVFFHDSTDNTAVLHIDTAGRTVVFNRGIGDMNGLESTSALPSTEAAPAIAKSLLGELNLAPERTEELFVEHVGGLNMGVETPEGQTQVFEKIRTVRFGRQLGGQRVIGRGSRIQVQLGSEGEMRGVIRRWDEVKSNNITPEAKFTASEIREMITFRLRTSASHAKAIKFNSAELVLFDDGKGVIEPVIRVVVDLTIESETRNEDGKVETRVIENPLDFFVPVLRNPKAELPFVKDQQLAQEKPAALK